MRATFLLLASYSQLIRSRATTALPLAAEVALSTGTVINGVVDRNYSSVRQFLGIPYAEPPLGKLRFEPPRPNQLPATLNATTIGKSCTQFTNKLSPNEDPEYSIADRGHTGEDCLTLSVWAPQGATSLPVLVYFYGGGW
jgi:cholinesterase